jgi:Uma2 family endonuclease
MFIMVTTVTLAETRTVLKNISWQTFKSMLADMGEERNTRLAYDNGIVEIMSPYKAHENPNRLIEAFVVVMCEEMGLEISRTGSLTLTRDDLEKGGEPDSSYYIQNESVVRGLENIDLATDPPPDLVLEVEYSRSAVNKLTLYAAMGIPEFWRYNGTVLRVYVLNQRKYEEVQLSPTFGRIPVKEIPRFIREIRTNGEISTTRAFRTWVKSFIN